MRKDRIYTLLIFCLSFTVVFGGWILTKKMLGSQKNKILSAKGQIVLENTEASGEGGGMTVSREFIPQVLSEDQMAEVLAVWETGGREVLHEPMAGQMNMEQAIEAGGEWIKLLTENQILSEELAEYQFQDTSAVLCTLESLASLEETLISYWKINYSEDDVSIVLKIHAATGQVWKADISIHEDKNLFGTCNDKEAFAIMFQFLAGGTTGITVEGNKAYKISENGKIYAALIRDSIVVNAQEPVERLLLNLGTHVEL